jgi:H+/Cl- antiporter ClcA
MHEANPPPSTTRALPGSTAPPGAPTPPKYRDVILMALVAAIFTALWLGVYGFLNRVIWSSALLTSRRWLVPVAVVFFSLLIGLTVKYLHAPTVISGGAMESLKGSGEERVDYRTFPGALLSSFLSVLSGASVGPEGPLGFLVQDIAAWVHQKRKLARETWIGFEASAFASLYNGIIGSPLFTAALATEYKVGGSSSLVYLAWNLLAGVIGYLFFTLLGIATFAKYVAFTPISGITLLYALDAILLSLVGCLVAVFVRFLFQLFGRIVPRVFGGRVVLRIVAAGVIIGIVGYFVPQVLFAGETQIFPMVHNPASYGVLALLGLGVLKLVLLALSFKSGYLGGPTFPTLFACTMFGLAANLLFPAVPVSLCVLCIEVAALTLASGAPLTMILLVAVVGTADTFTVALLVLSSAVALMVAAALMRLQARRGAQAAAPPVGPGAPTAGDATGAAPA